MRLWIVEVVRMAPTLKRLADSRLPPVSVPATSRGTFGSESMFRKRRPTNPAAPGSNPNPSGSKRQRTGDGLKILLDVAKESSDWFPPLKSALGGVNALIKHYEQSEDVREMVEDLIPHLNMFKQNTSTAGIGEDQAEENRRLELSSALEHIENRSRALLGKGTAARFMDKGKDSKEVANLINGLREAISHYQISQQQAIYHQVTNLASSFDTLLKLHEKSPAVKSKLDSVMTRLSKLCSEEDNEDVAWSKNEHVRRMGLFDTLRSIRDNGNELHNRINAPGFGECQGDIQAVSGIVEDIRDAILDYQTAQQRAMYAQCCELINTADLSVLNSCRRARGAGYRHGDRRGCLRGTRETVLEEIESWTRDFEKSPVFWLNGLAGTGKSTIAQTIADRVFAGGQLGASFFCSRDFEDRSDLHFIFPTLAFQLAHKYPNFRSRLVPLLQSDPDVVDESLYSQMERLIVEPLESAGISTVIVIDALDECKDEEPSSAILSVLGRFVERIPTVRFFITGRPEPRIKTGFRLPLLVDSTDVFVLHDVHPTLVNEDIRLYLKHELSGLARRRRLDRWPSDEHIDLLCRRAAGLFVYAVATTKFLDSNTHLPKQRLDAIVSLPECTVLEGKTRFKPNTTLDSLYTSILEMAFCEEDPEVDSKVRSTVGAVVLLVNPLPPSGIAELIGLDLEEVRLFLMLVQSLFVLDENSDLPINPFHKSFPDFITDPSRCLNTRFCISPGSLHLKLVMDCLRLMNDGLEQNLLSLPDYTLNSEVEDISTRIKDRVSVALQYACRSWYNHLAETREDVTEVVSCLRFFLEERFLAWLELASVLGVARGVVDALEKAISWLQEVAGDEQLLTTARDYRNFVTKFFEVINVSATHIYHSALELSPLSSIVRKSYHDRRPTDLPTVVVGLPDSWDQCIIVSSNSRPVHHYQSCTWSPCGRFVAARTPEAVDIRDPLTFELRSALNEPDGHVITGLAYSPDGHSLACLSTGGLIIWDVQTGGVAKRTRCNNPYGASLLWSLDGRTIAIMTCSGQGTGAYSVSSYDVASGTTTRPPSGFQSRCEPHLWAHGKSFRVMAVVHDGGVLAIDILNPGSVLTKVESFPVRTWGDTEIGSFSPATHYLSILGDSHLVILDIRNSTCLLRESGVFFSHCFASDGSLFAACSTDTLHIWTYTSGHYAPWREFTYQNASGVLPSLLFSPTFVSILGCFGDVLQIWRLYDNPTALPVHHQQFAVVSRGGVYFVTSSKGDPTVTITNPLLDGLYHIYVGTEIQALAVFGNILLVIDYGGIVAWRLTDDGTVAGVLGDRDADRSDSIWTVSSPDPRGVPELSFGLEQEVWDGREIGGGREIGHGQEIGVIKYGLTSHVYHTGTGEVLQPDQEPRYCEWYALADICNGKQVHYPKPRGQGFGTGDDCSEGEWPFSRATLREGWVKDPDGRHRLWIPSEWGTRANWKWFHKITTLRFEFPASDKQILIMF